MAKLTWRGPDDYGEGETPPRSCTWAGITFPVGVAVEVDDPWMIAKARGNRMFKVEDELPLNPYTPEKPGHAIIEDTGAKAAAPTQWREPDTEADPADEYPKVIHFFDDPPPPDTPPPLDYGLRAPDVEPKRKPGRPRNKVTPNGDSQ